MLYSFVQIEATRRQFFVRNISIYDSYCHVFYKRSVCEMHSGNTLHCLSTKYKNKSILCTSGTGNLSGKKILFQLICCHFSTNTCKVFFLKSTFLFMALVYRKKEQKKNMVCNTYRNHLRF